MPAHAATLSVEHVVRALQGPGRPCLQLLRTPAGARAFVASVLFRRLRRPLLFLAPTTAEAEDAGRELSAYLGEDAVLPFPSVEVTPYEALAPYPPAVHARIRALHALASGDPVVVVGSVEAALHKTIPPRVLEAATVRIAFGETLDLDALAKTLGALGYARLPRTADPGDFSIRGGIVDIYSPADPLPARIALDGDVVESIRRFDPASQRTLPGGAKEGPSELETVTVLPCTQIVMRDDYVAAARAGKAFGTEDALSQGIRFHGVEWILPDFYGGAASVFDALPPGAPVVAADAVACLGEARKVFGEAEELYELSGRDAGLSPPAEIFLAPEALAERLARVPLLSFDTVEVGPFGRGQALRGELDAQGNEDIRRSTATSSSEGLLFPLVSEAKAWIKRGDRFVVTSLSPSQTDRMEELLSRYAVPLSTGLSLATAVAAGRGLCLCCSPATRGFRLPELGLAVVTESELFGEKARVRRARRETAAPVEEFSLRELRVNDLAVHVDHGVGVYRGLLRRAAGGVEGDFLVLEYAGGDRLFVPVEKMSRVQRYVASEGEGPKLARLGGTAWQRAKQKVRDALLSMAQEIVELQARRRVAVKSGGAPPGALFREFEAAFPHEETPDQQRVIEEVLADLSANAPMDRLVCGDVGYGKTEVAIRAAFKAALDGKQTAVLVPTTVLAEQHHQTFRQRLHGYPVRVESLSRFGSREDQAAIVRDLAAGKVDVVIGTHRLLQKDVRFKELGLVVIDEEHRFGVAHKERLKRMRTSVDVLTLTATPIPRTLHMAFSGIRDISIIATPPEDRLSIRTFVLPFAGETIREAVEREIRRGGQVYFVHNRVLSLPAMERYLREILPDARIGAAHGQMGEEALARTMDDFAGRRIDILLCTAIIEAGLDIPNANTILVNQAHRFGLAQLYQLRGRVGRDRHRAYAYFLVPRDVMLSREANQRLAVLEELTELGSGFKVASHDLEIRGAGNLLGRDQSGHIHQVGYELYSQLLEESLAEVSGGRALEEEEPELDLRIPAFLPDDYIPEAGERLDVYRRLAKARTMDAVDEQELSLLDRFGRLPAQAKALVDLSRLRVRMRDAGVRELKRGERALFVQLSPRSGFDRSLLLRWVTREKATFSFVRGEALAMRLPDERPETVLSSAKNLLNRFFSGSSI